MIDLTTVTTETEGVVTRLYKNWKGKVAERTILPVSIVFKYSEYHCKTPEDKVWIIEAYDLDKKAMRDFCMDDFINEV